ncbi:MAG: SCO family protein [Pirellulaceae bacterium]
MKRTTQWTCLGLIGIVMLAGPGCQPGLEEGQAGYAYVENEAGELIPAEQASSKPARPMRVIPKGSEEKWLSSFDLIERSGESMTSDQLRGQPYVASFFFSLCPTICVQQNERVQQLQEKFAGQPVRFVSISCDPEVDRPEVLAAYAEKFNADKDQWLFFTGDLNYIRRVGAEMYSLPVNRRFHAEKFLLVDSEGQIHGVYEWTDPEQWQALQRDIAKLLEASNRKES